MKLRLAHRLYGTTFIAGSHVEVQLMSRRLWLAGLTVSVTLVACGGTSPSPSGSAPINNTGSTAPVASTAPAAAPCTKRNLDFDHGKVDLTGPWLGDDDGIYYLRQIGKNLWWSGMSGQAGPPASLGRDWNNVANGQVNDDLTIHLNWADVPRGEILGGGTLVWRIEDDGSGNVKLTKVSETGSGFGGSAFTPCRPG